MTTTTSPPVNFWQVRAARATAAKSDSSSSTVPSSSASTSTATSVSTPVSLPLPDEADPFVVKATPKNRLPPALDDTENWPQIGKQATQNEPKKPGNDSPRKSEKPKSKWFPIPAQELQAAADTARAQRSRQPSNTSSTSASISNPQSRSRSRPQSQTAVTTNGSSKEKTTVESTRTRHSPSGSVVAHKDSSAAAPQVMQSNELPSTHHPHPHQHHPPHPTPPRFSAMSHSQHMHGPPPPSSSVVYPPYLHTPYVDSNSSSGVNGVVNGSGYYPHSQPPQPHNASPHLSSHGVPPPPSLSHSHSHSHSSSMSVPYSYSMYDYSSGYSSSPARSMTGSGVTSGMNSGYQTPFHGAGHATLGKLVFGSIEGPVNVSRSMTERGSTFNKGLAIGEGVIRKKGRRRSKDKENKREEVTEKTEAQSSSFSSGLKGKGKETDIIDLTEGKGVGMSDAVKKGIESVDEQTKKEKPQTRKWVFGTMDSSSDAPAAGDSETHRHVHRAQPSHLQIHLQQLPPLTVPVLSPIPPLPSILPTPLSSVPMPIQPLQSISSYPPPQHYYYENASLDDMSWTRHQHQQAQMHQYTHSSMMGIFGGQKSTERISQVNGANNELGVSLSRADVEGDKTKEDEADGEASKLDTSVQSNDTSELASSVSKEEPDLMSVPLSSTTATSNSNFEARNFGYGFGHATGSGTAAQDAKDGISAREQERFRDQERDFKQRERERGGEVSPGQGSPKYSSSRNLPNGPDGPIFPLRGRRGRGRGFRGERGGRGWYAGGRGRYNNQQHNSSRGQYGGGGSGHYSPHNPYAPHSPGGLYTPPYGPGQGQWPSQSGQYGQYGQYAQPPDASFTLTPPPAFHPLPLPGDGEGGMYYNPTYYNPQIPPPPRLSQPVVNGQQPHSPSSSSSPLATALNGASVQSSKEKEGQDGQQQQQHGRDLSQAHAQAPVPAPITSLSFPLDPTRYYLLGQVEYYLSPQNMAQDLFLRKQMDSRGWVPISLIASFNRVRSLTTDERLVREVVALSSVVEARGDSVRMRGDWERYVLPGAPISKVDSRENLLLGVVPDQNNLVTGAAEWPQHQYGAPEMGLGLGLGPGPQGMGQGQGQGQGVMGFEGSWYDGYPYWGNRNQRQQEQQQQQQQQFALGAGKVTEEREMNLHSLPVPAEGIVNASSQEAHPEKEDVEDEDEEEEDVVFVLGDSKETNMSGMWSPDRRS
ncbi:hypothetical protein D9758_005754 [Tetrapyrgos nigripes]|uniref:HTH La-type RNA-binding domain-containing protein n=1 Tax=Tetrapyrgos nigripes TaxID=182062 RepID=A0A8H5GJC1_9AGAR|nr:hypothetical protein D9758_005754 [Tetrapyrgos nigripes]